MDFSSINWLAVLVCVVLSMVIGSIWFNQLAWNGSMTATALGYKLCNRAGKVLG